MAQEARLPRRPTLVSTAVVAGLGVLIVTSCGSTATDSTADNPAGGFHVTYKLTSTTGEQNFDKLDVLTDGRTKVRTTIGIFGTKAEVGRVVSDGSRAVRFSPADNGRYGAGSSYADMKLSEVHPYVLRDGDGSLAAWCGDANPVGTAQVLGRSARHYTCKDPGIEELERAKELSSARDQRDNAASVSAGGVHANALTWATLQCAEPARSPRTGPVIEPGKATF